MKFFVLNVRSTCRIKKLNTKEWRKRVEKIRKIVVQKDISRTVQHPDGMCEKTIPVSAGTGPYTLVSPSRRQEGEKTVAGMTRVRNDPLGLSPAPLAVKVLNGW